MHVQMRRGIYAFDDEEDPDWKRALARFPYRVPRFADKYEATKFMERFCLRGSNPDRPHFRHIFTVLTTWDQLDRHLVSVRNRHYGPPGTADTPSSAPASAAEARALEVLSLPLYSRVKGCFYTTLRYLFNHMRCGIYVLIRKNRLVMFVPFANEDYTNTWHHHLVFEGAPCADAYYERKHRQSRRENILRDTSRWWCNGHVVDNELAARPGDKSQVWGDYFLCPLREMLEALCR